MHMRIVGSYSNSDHTIEFEDTEDFFVNGMDEQMMAFASGFWWAMFRNSKEEGVPAVSVYGTDGRPLADFVKGSWGGPDVLFPIKES
jgi:hypothetical protein